MQNDWPKWLVMTEFSDNDRLSEAIKLTPFYANKGFHPRMTFGPDTASYESTRERLLAAKVEDITGTMANILTYMRSNALRSKAVMSAKANKHRKPVRYAKGDMIWLSSRNIITVRPFKKLEDKMLGPFKVLRRIEISYKLELPEAMKVHDVFHPNLLRLNPEDPPSKAKTQGLLGL